MILIARPDFFHGFVAGAAFVCCFYAFTRFIDWIKVTQ